MNILYIHGYGSKFNPNNNNVKSLTKNLPQYLVSDDLPVCVVGINIEYRIQNPITVTLDYLNDPQNPDIDLIIGHSLGGWVASHVGSRTGVPWVALNPTVSPAKECLNALGLAYDNDFHVGDDGLVIVEKGDEKFDYRETIDYLDMEMDFSIYEGGSHRFENMKDACEDIADHWNTVSTRG